MGNLRFFRMNIFTSKDCFLFRSEILASVFACE